MPRGSSQESNVLESPLQLLVKPTCWETSVHKSPDKKPEAWLFHGFVVAATNCKKISSGNDDRASSQVHGV